MRFLSSSSCKDLEEETLSLCITRYELGKKRCGREDLRRVPGGGGGQEKRTTGEEGDCGARFISLDMGDGTYW